MPADSHPTTVATRPFQPRNPVVIGILGGVAAGKSTVAALFAARGLRHVDADALARAVARDPAVRAAVAAAFGPGAVTSDGFDRAALAATVFADPTARQRLESILHPPIRARIVAALQAARAAGASVLLDAPLLLETGLAELCDEVVFVDADTAVRRARAAARGWPVGELERREAAQADLTAKRARATRYIDNSRDLDATSRQVDALLAALEAQPA